MFRNTEMIRWSLGMEKLVENSKGNWSCRGDGSFMDILRAHVKSERDYICRNEWREKGGMSEEG